MSYKKYEIIDFHCHVFPEKIAEKATRHVGDYYSLEMHGDGTAKRLVEAAEADGINPKFLIHSSATKPQQVESVNDFVSETAKDKTRFIGFGTIHRDYENPAKELARLKTLGLQGLKLHPDFQAFFIDDEKMMKIYEIAEKENLPLLFHVGDLNTDFSTPKRLAKVADIFPKLKIVAAHMGGYSVWQEAVKHLYSKENVWVDTSSTTCTLSHSHISELIHLKGAQKVLFGSDYPIQTTSEAAIDVMQFDLTEKEREMIFAKNAIELLNL